MESEISNFSKVIGCEITGKISNIPTLTRVKLFSIEDNCFWKSIGVKPVQYLPAGLPVGVIILLVKS